MPPKSTKNVDNAFLYKRVKKVKDFRMIKARYKGEIFGFDLITYVGSESGSNYGIIVLCVDYWSRYCWTRVITKKNMQQLNKALLSIFEEAGGPPDHIHADQEAALVNSKMLKEKGVRVYHTTSTIGHQSGGSPISERLVKTLRGKLEILRDTSVARSWKHHVQRVTDEYNNEKHSTIKMTPYEAYWDTEKDDEIEEIHEERYEKHVDNIDEPKKLHEEDKNVLIPKEKKTFEKGFTRKWSKEVLKIEEVLNTKPVTYKLSNGKIVYHNQIQALNKKQEEYLKPKSRKK